MSTTGENVLVAPCGLSCGHCPQYLAKDDPAMMEYLVSLGVNREKLPCKGCRPLEGKMAWVACAKETANDPLVDGGTCATYACSIEQGVEFCYECPDFPCVKLQPCTDWADRLPQNLKVFNLCCIKRQGLDAWLKSYPEIYLRYYSGKMVIGQGPQMTEDRLRAVQEFQDQLQQVRGRLQQNVDPGKSQ